MQKPQRQQWIVLGATLLTLVLGAGFTYFQATHTVEIWPLVLVLGLVWGTIGGWIFWRASRKTDSDAKP